MTLIESAKALQPHLVKLYHEFHTYPELSCTEARTSERILRELDAIGGYQITKKLGSGGHGILAELKGDLPGETVVLRADIDALPIQEKTGLPYASQTENVMHACGHDMHITGLLGTARLLAEHRRELRGTVRLIFQPAEEDAPVGGARSMIEAGALDGASGVFGLHVWPELPLGTVGVKPGSAMAASDHFTVNIVGKACHAARPQDGCDAVVAGAQFVTAIQTIISRNRNPLESAVLTVGVVEAGNRYNVVAEECLLHGTCRTFNPEVRDMVERRLSEVLDGVCALSGCTATLKYRRGYDALVNDEQMSRYVHQVAADLFGSENAVFPMEATMCAEDFSFYTGKVPGAFAWLGTGGTEGGDWPLHNCHFAPDESVLWRAAALLAQLTCSYPGQKTSTPL
ncbi:MAG: M20 metallopeptidase family protein [Lachnospiraceae bacterium]